MSLREKPCEVLQEEDAEGFGRLKLIEGAGNPQPVAQTLFACGPQDVRKSSRSLLGVRSLPFRGALWRQHPGSLSLLLFALWSAYVQNLLGQTLTALRAWARNPSLRTPHDACARWCMAHTTTTSEFIC